MPPPVRLRSGQPYGLRVCLSAPRRVSDPARMAAVSFRHFFVLQSFAPFIFRTESLDLLPLRRSALAHTHHPHPAGGRPGSSSRIRTISFFSVTERRSRRDRSVVRGRTLFFPDDESGRPPAAGLALPGPLGLGHGSGFNRLRLSTVVGYQLSSTGGTLSHHVLIRAQKFPLLGHSPLLAAA